MPTVIDSLVVTLGLDPSQFTQGQKDAVVSLRKTEEAAVHTAKEMSSQATKAAAFFSKMKVAALEFAAAYVGFEVAKNFSARITETDFAVGKLATVLGMSTEELSSWGAAAQRAGGTAEGMGRTLSGIQNGVQQFWAGGSQETVTAFAQIARFGELSQDSLSRWMSRSTGMGDRLHMLSDAFSHMRETGQTAMAVSLGAGMGIEQDQVLFLAQGWAKVSQQRREAQGRNAVSSDDAAAAEARRVAWQNLFDTVEGLARKVETRLTPSWVTFEGWVQKTLEAASKIDLGKAFSDSLPAVQEFCRTADKYLGEFSSFLASDVTPAVLALADAVGDLLHPFRVVFDFLQSEFTTTLQNISNLIKLTVGNIKDLGTWADKMWPSHSSDSEMTGSANYPPGHVWQPSSGFFRPPAERFIRPPAAAGRASSSPAPVPVTVTPGPLERGLNWLTRQFGEARSLVPSTLPTGGLPDVLAAIRRQESGNRQFGRNGRPIVSGAGATGIMQVMPDSGREAYNRLRDRGVDLGQFSESRMLLDEQFNRTLGEEEYRWDLEQFGGNQTLALAAYNAGAGRVRGWIARYGDPRTGAISEEDWLAQIRNKRGTSTETRDYVRNINAMTRRGVIDPSLSNGLTPARQHSALPGYQPSNQTASSEVNIGTLQVQTRATDSDGIARGIKASLERFNLATQANMALG